MRILLILTVVLVSSTLAQPERLVIRNYTTADGLPSLVVTGIVQDSAGVIWAATDRGIVGCYDDRFAIDRAFEYDFISPGPIHVARARTDNGYFWVGAGYAKEVSYFRTEYGWEGYDIRGLFPEWEGDSTHGSGFTAVLETAAGEVILGTSGEGLWTRLAPGRQNRRHTWYYRDTPVRHIALAEHVTALIASSEGIVWVGTKHGLYRLAGERCIRLEGSPLRTAHVTSFTSDPSGAIWVGTTSGAFVLRNHVALRSTAIPAVHVTDIGVAPNGEVWVGTATRGLLRIRGEARTAFGVRDGLPSDQITTVRVDRSGNVWVGTDRGLAKVLPWSYREYVSGRDLPAGPWHSSFIGQDRSLWFGGTGALARFSGSELKTWTAPFAMRQKPFRQVLQDMNGVVWALTDDGVVRFDGQTFRYVHDDSSASDGRLGALMVYEPRQGLIVIRSRSIRRLQGDAFEVVAVNQFERTFSDAAFDADGNLWVTSWSGCVAISPDGARTTFPFLTSCVRVEPLSDGSVAIVDLQLGIVLSTEAWMAKTSGVPSSWNLNGRPFGAGNFTDGFVTKDGRRMAIWGASSFLEQSAPNGDAGSRDSYFDRILSFALHRADGTVLLLANSGGGKSFVSYDPVSGTLVPQLLLESMVVPRLPLDDLSMIGTGIGTHVRGLTEDDEGTLWCATQTGILALPADGGPAHQQPPTLLSLTAGDERMLPGLVSSVGLVSTVNRWWKSRDHGTLSGFADSIRFSLRAEDNDLQFEAVSSENRSELGVLFQARLDDQDTAWSDPQPIGRFSYRDVPQGKYRFRVRTMTASGAVSPERTMIISLIVPFWRSRWFEIVSSITVMYLFVRITSKRVRRLREEHTRFTRQAVHENELRMARAMQMGMLPERCPEIQGYEIAASSLPATEVGGDFFDFIQDGNRIGIAVGDVSGHGISGAMIVGMARTSLRFASSRFERPSRVLTLANDRLRQDISRNVFIAMFYGLLDPKRRTLHYICAGQPTPILVRKGTATFLPHGKGDRFPLGIVARVSYLEERLVLRAGDIVVLYTDGFVEAMNGAKEEYGFDRFRQTLERHASGTAQELLDGVVAEVRTHSAGVLQEDDMTMVVIRVRKEARS